MPMSEDKKSLLFVTNDDKLKTKVTYDLEAKKNRVVIASNDSEARLKVVGEEFQFVIVDMDMNDFDPIKFIESIRRKEKLKSIKDLLPIIIFGESSDNFQKDYSEFEVVTFLEKPLDYEELKTKLAILGGSSAIKENTREIKKGDILVEEGSKSNEMYWVISGSFEASKKNSETDQVHVIGKIATGELIGEMSFLDSQPRSATVKALTDSEVLVIPHKKFVNALDDQPRWMQTLMKTLSLRLRSSNDIISGKKET